MFMKSMHFCVLPKSLRIPGTVYPSDFYHGYYAQLMFVYLVLCAFFFQGVKGEVGPSGPSGVQGVQVKP